MESDVVYFKDARNMSEVSDDSVRLIITSPPYWNVKDYSKDGHQKNKISKKIKGQIGDIDDFQEYLNAMTEVWKECERILKPNGKLCINTPLMPISKNKLNNQYTRHIADINAGIEHEVLHKTKLKLLDIYIWNRTNPTKALMFGSYPHPPNFYAQNTVEFITVFVKGGAPEKVSDSIKKMSKITQKEWVDYTKQVWNIPVPSKNDVAYGEHSAIMPEEIVKRLVKLFSFVDDVVLDPFAGSGTTLKVAKLMGRRYIGYEINEEYKKVVNKKLAQNALNVYFVN